jgi:hypothetical protein
LYIRLWRLVLRHGTEAAEAEEDSDIGSTAAAVVAPTDDDDGTALDDTTAEAAAAAAATALAQEGAPDETTTGGKDDDVVVDDDDDAGDVLLEKTSIALRFRFRFIPAGDDESTREIKRAMVARPPSIQDRKKSSRVIFPITGGGVCSVAVLVEATAAAGKTIGWTRQYHLQHSVNSFKHCTR